MKTEPCPNCGRPIGFEYTDTEAGKCQLWRHLNEHAATSKTSMRTIADCFAHTSRRIRDLEAKVGVLETGKRAAQAALSRHHAARYVKIEPFRNNARIE